MDLKKLNEDYKKSKSQVAKLENAKAKCEELKKQIKMLSRQIEDFDRAKMRADEDGDKDAIKKIEEDLKEPLAQLQKSRNL